MFPIYPTAIQGIPADAESWTYGNRPSFSLVSVNGDKIVYPLDSCKEYILDYSYYSFVGPTGIYNTFTAFASINEVRLLVGNWKDYIVASTDFLNQIETVLDIPHSMPFQVPNNKNIIYVFRGSSRWLIAPPMLSFYGLIIRAGNKHTVGNHYEDTFQECINNSDDNDLWSGGMPAIRTLLKYGDRSVFGQDPKKNWLRNVDGNIHDCGIQAWGNYSLAKNFPDYYYLLPEKKQINS